MAAGEALPAEGSEVHAAQERLDRAYVAFADAYGEPPEVRRACDDEVRAAIAHLSAIEHTNCQAPQ